MRQRILTGIRPTGALHVGHYFGMLEQTNGLLEEFDVLLMVADVQALTDNFHQPQVVREHVLEVARGILAAGIDPQRCTLFVQSLVPEIAELTVFFSNLVNVARLQQNPTVKAEIAQKRALFGESVPYGFLGYPVSQAADITAFDAAVVPVGEDQLPMLEQTREIVRKFNGLYGQTLVLPEARVVKSARVKGLDGAAKMGKSLGNAVYLNDPSDVVVQKISGALTDPQKQRLGDAGRPEVCTVYAYHTLVNAPNLETVALQCRSGTRGCVLCKRELSGAMTAFLEPMGARRAGLQNDVVMDVLMAGTRRARGIAQGVVARVKRAMHLDYATEAA